MRALAIETVEIFLHHQLAMPCDQQALDLRRRRTSHRIALDALDERGDHVCIETRILQRCGRPAIVQTQRLPVGVAGRRGRPRIEARRMVAVAAREGEQADALPVQAQLIVVFVEVAVQLPGGSPRVAQCQCTAIDRYLVKLASAQVELRIRDGCHQCTIGPAPDLQVLGNAIGQRLHLPRPHAGLHRLQGQRRGVGTAQRDPRRLYPEPVNRRRIGGQIATEPALIAGQADLDAIALTMHDRLETSDRRPPFAAAPVDHQCPGDLRREYRFVPP